LFYSLFLPSLAADWVDTVWIHSICRDFAPPFR